MKDESAEIKNLKVKVKLLEDILTDVNYLIYNIKSDAANTSNLLIEKSNKAENANVLIEKDVYDKICNYLNCVSNWNLHLISNRSYIKEYIDRINTRKEILALL